MSKYIRLLFAPDAIGATVGAAGAAGQSTTAAVSASGLSASPRAGMSTAGFGESGSGSTLGGDTELNMDDDGYAAEHNRAEEAAGDDRMELGVNVKAQHEKTIPQAKVEKQVTETPVEGEDTAPTAPQPAGRDYSQFEPQDVELFKKLPNHLFNAMKDRYAQVKEIATQNAKLTERIKQIESGALPDSYVQHPQAFTLSPEYTQAAQLHNQAQFEVGIVEKAINAIEMGLPYQVLTGYDAQDNPVFRTVQPKLDKDGNALLDIAAKNSYMRVLQQIDRKREGAEQQMQSVKAQFGAMRGAQLNEFKQMQAQTFPVFEKPEYKQQIDATVAQLPAYLRHDPAVAQFCARGSMLINALHAKVKELQGAQAVSKTISADRRAAGPSPSVLASAGGGVREDSTNTLSMSDWSD